jgi:hypothetical protein
MVILKVDGSVEEHEIEQAPGLAEMQKAVGGSIELVPYFREYEERPCLAFCNEGGKVIGLPHNKHATQLWAAQLRVPYAMMADILVGDILILQGDEAFMRRL